MHGDVAVRHSLLCKGQKQCGNGMGMRERDFMQFFCQSKELSEVVRSGSLREDSAASYVCPVCLELPQDGLMEEVKGDLRLQHFFVN